MKSARIALATTAVMLVAACNGGSPTPDPEVQTLFDPVVKYVIDANVGTNGTERITLTIGKPIPVAEYKKAGTKIACIIASKDDVVVPLDMKLENTSPADGPKSGLGITLRLAVDQPQARFKAFAVTVQDADGKKCGQLFPFNNITNDPLVEGTAVQPFGTWPSTAKQGTLYANTTHMFLTGGGASDAPPPSMFFLRLTPNKGDDAYYKITKVTAHKLTANNKVSGPAAVAGVVTGGKTKGAFYVPLDGVTYPCTTLGRNAPMSCGAELTPPK